MCMKIKVTSWKLIVVIFAFVVVCYALIYGIGSRQYNNNENDTSVLLEDGWTLDYNGEIVNNYSFDTMYFPQANKGERLIRKGRLKITKKAPLSRCLKKIP